MHEIVLIVASFTLTVALILVLVRFAPRLGLLDHPDQRKQHEGPVPLVGGLALYLMLMTVFLSGLASNTHTLPFLIAITLVTGIGAHDDRVRASPRIRLLTQFVAALVLAYGADLRLESFGSIAPNGQDVYLGPFAIAVTIFGIMSVINAMNFIDGLDGLAGGLALIAVVGIWVIGFTTQHSVPDLVPVLAGGLIAFLTFNGRLFGRKRAVIFLGDAGSTLLGLVLALLMIDSSQGTEKIITPVVALWLLAVPLFDFLAIVLRRLSMKRSPLKPDREHLHHLINNVVKNEKNTVSIIYLIGIIAAVIGMLAEIYNYPMNKLLYIYLLLFILTLRTNGNSWLLVKILRIKSYKTHALLMRGKNKTNGL